MFRRTREISFSRYERRRSPWRLPRWLWLLLAGAGLGAGGLGYVQQELLPPRLTAEASARTVVAYRQAEAERQRLAAAQAPLTAQLAAADAARQQQAAELAASRATAERLQRELAVLVDAFPPDPRAGAVAVRAMRFADTGRALAYDLALSRERDGGQLLAATMQIIVTGRAERGGRDEVAVTLPPVPVSLGPQAVLRGSQPLPAGFRPRQASVRFRAGPGGPVLGMRVGLVR